MLGKSTIPMDGSWVKILDLPGLGVALATLAGSLEPAPSTRRSAGAATASEEGNSGGTRGR